MKLICNACHIEISKQISELEDLTLLNSIDGQNYVPEGFYIISDGTYLERLKGSIIINTNDLLNSNYHSDISRLNGCCGCDGSGGMNKVCLNNHELGTEHSDCWMAHMIALNPAKVKFVQ
nr:hypothetical protein [Lysinibacillus timonensis]